MLGNPRGETSVADQVLDPGFLSEFALSFVQKSVPVGIVVRTRRGCRTGGTRAVMTPSESLSSLLVNNGPRSGGRGKIHIDQAAEVPLVAIWLG